MSDLLEARFERDFPGYRAVRTARGAAALFLALDAIRRERGAGEVILPSTVCASVPLAVLYAGMALRFCDVEPETFCLSERTVRPVLSQKTRAIVAVHLFGKAAPVGTLARLSERRGIALVEDVAQGPGGRAGGRRLGGFGDFSVFSFNDSKVLTGHGGMLLVRSDREAQPLRRAEAALPPRLRADAGAEVALSFRNMNTGLQDLLRAECMRTPLPLLAELAPRYRSIFIARARNDPTALAEMAASYDGLDAERRRRRERYVAYATHLDPKVKYVRFAESETCWRLPLLVRSHRVQLELLHAIRRAGGLASSHYFPTSALFGDPGGCETARRIGSRALNLCVDRRTDAKLIRWICNRLNQAAAGKGA